ncbi:hypothetical protein IE81DRAFT_226829 [Ceraceosorus guamensis]|uniref:Uncharacterized protein n=1 Tax=Ceraceosorus guamensis TaxID=1522189 RepID=A0A316WAP0_9BASI|nr:hypothetical protein IE81DRAFT_226829 [Ceraceosorus guamensis]PWN45043.1 hypothetical protein IE81DRAFT_226829 [Ceraceosorus guamensis]
MTSKARAPRASTGSSNVEMRDSSPASSSRRHKNNDQERHQHSKGRNAGSTQAPRKARAATVEPEASPPMPSMTWTDVTNVKSNGREKSRSKVKMEDLGTVDINHKPNVSLPSTRGTKAAISAEAPQQTSSMPCAR